PHLDGRRGGTADDELYARTIVIDARNILVELGLVLLADGHVLRAAGDGYHDVLLRAVAPVEGPAQRIAITEVALGEGAIDDYRARSAARRECLPAQDGNAHGGEVLGRYCVPVEESRLGLAGVGRAQANVEASAVGEGDHARGGGRFHTR